MANKLWNSRSRNILSISVFLPRNSLSIEEIDKDCWLSGKYVLSRDYKSAIIFYDL